MKLRYLFLAAVLFAGACSRPSETFSTGIIPVPQHVNWGEGTFRMPRTLTYVTDLEGQEKADLAAWMERSVAGRFFPVPFVEALEGDIPALRLRIADKGAPESYRLDVVRDSMTITAPDAAGLFYGLQSLAQLAEPPLRSKTLRVSLTGASCSTYRVISGIRSLSNGNSICWPATSSTGFIGI